MPNRLAHATSPYLLMHASDLVNWWEWGSEALAEAQLRDVPILLSVGYASCHWCHVMRDESFEDVATAAFINEHFVPIKVDRQQRPDIDAAFMRATQAMNHGSGGWPLTAFLTPEGMPFFTGTYFPPQPQPGMPSFNQVLEAMADGWHSRRDKLVASAQYVVTSLAGASSPGEAPELRAAIEAVVADFDPIHGGWGGAPKFPAPTLLDALLIKGDPQTLELAQRTLEAMARGGVYDQVGGGFHRYSVDAGWVVPHFEKMLYDNALLLGVYARGWRRTASHESGLRALFERAAYGIVDWMERELVSEGGGFMAGLDADSCDIRGAVHEGIFYLWNPELLDDALGPEEAQWAGEVFHVTRGGTFEDGLSTLQLRGRPDFARLERICKTLRAERETRFRPGTDRLVVASWNGWAISSLVAGALIFNESKWIDLALRAAEYLVRVHLANGDLHRSSLEGEAGESIGGAEDFGAVAEAFVALACATGDPAWLKRAETLADRAVELLAHPDGGFYDAIDTGLFERTRSMTDNVTPSGAAALITALRSVALLSERPDLMARADKATRTLWSAVGESPQRAGAALADQLICDEARRGLKPAVVVVVSADPMGQLTRAAWRLAPAGSLVLTAPEGTEGFGSWLKGRSDGMAYICRDTTCFPPVCDYVELKTPLWTRV